MGSSTHPLFASLLNSLCDNIICYNHNDNNLNQQNLIDQKFIGVCDNNKKFVVFFIAGHKGFAVSDFRTLSFLIFPKT